MIQPIKTSLFFIIFFSFLMAFPYLAFAQVVKQVKGNQALVEFPSDVTEGEEYFALNPQGKRVGLLVLKKVKGTKAIANIAKGKAQAGYSLVSRASLTSASPSTQSASEDSDETASETSDFSMKKNAWGGLLALWQNSMSAVEKDSLNVQETANMTGTSFGVGGFYDYSFTPNLQIRGIGSYDMYNVASTIAINGCDSKTSKDCNVKIGYLSFFGNLKYNFTLSKTRFFVIAGTGFLYAVSKSSTALKASDISLTQVFTGGLGLDYKLNNKSFIPISIEYGLFPPSEDVKASSIILRVGFGLEL